MFYSDNTDSPDFIFCSRGITVWLRDGYDYEQEIFEIDNTDIKTVFADVFSDESVEYFDFSAEKTAGFAWHPAAHPALKNYPDIFEKNGLYYIRFADEGEGYLIKTLFSRFYAIIIYYSSVYYVFLLKKHFCPKCISQKLKISYTTVEDIRLDKANINEFKLGKYY